MAEPRKPRVIRTRIPAAAQTTAATGAAKAADPKKSDPKKTGAKDPAPSGAAAKTAAVSGVPQLSGTVRGTSEKVAKLPVPVEVPDPSVGADPSVVTNAAKNLLRVPRPRARVKPRAPEAAKSGSATEGSAEAGSAKRGSGKSAATKKVTSKPAPATSAPAADASEDAAADGNTGAQVLAFPMPSYKRRRRAFLLTAAGVLAVLALVMGVALYSPVLGVKTVVFEGNKLVSEDTLGLALAPIISRPLPQVTAEDVSALLAPVVQIKSSRIEARPPSTLVVHVVERVPVALLQNGETYSLVDQDGVELGTTKDAAAAALPLIDGGNAAIGKDTFQAMTSVLATLPKSILTQLANATAKSPDAVELRLVDGRSVVWGNASDMELKATVLESLLNAPTPTAQPGKPAPVPAQVFDVSAPRHPVTR
ncbi:cell division protein FtsQ/DivIB [Specibacter sp. NPDC078709]|uniref:cell division protein FtsQ/DivIB n=1 Tax=Specibacter sp. NPDC078709 TaxID=3154364 RepID=UPI00343A94C7